MKKIMVLLLTLTCFCVGIYSLWPMMGTGKSTREIQQNTTSVYQKMDSLSQDIYLLTKEDKYSEAKKKLAELGVLFAATKPPKGLSIEVLDTITGTIIKAKRAFAAVQPDPNKLVWHALQVRLTIDSLTHEKQPLWKNYYNSYQEHINKMMLLAAGRKQGEFTRAFAQNLQLYQTLKPAITIHASMRETEMLFSMYSFLLQETRKPSYNWEGITNVLEELNKLIDGLFIGKDQSTLAPGVSPESPFLIISLFSSFLLTSLMYVAWRKYRAEKNAAQKNRKGSPE
ncbi:sporulation protein YpjB [Aneurinibacillus tyrosinisolvens]|uniref:sporulation protein YpjB n=1 Tax=Aneurinibacillus tyrosinisolvens TaxID=1443435 RepID=UPI00063EFBBE|nr:sporulation protein YpjB [Aneurinibacillus tyrosinisolvens]